MNIGKNIQTIRTWKRVSQEAVAEAIGVPQGTMSKIENNTLDVTWSKILGIATALSVSVQDLVCFDASKFSFHVTGEKASGMIINQNNSTDQQEIIKILQEENRFLRKIVEASIKNKPNKKTKT